MGRTVVGHPSQSGNVVTFPLLLALIADASSASSSWSFPSLSAAPASRSGGRVARREFLPNGRYSIHTCRPRHVVSTAALADEESLEPTAHPSSLRGTADVRITVDVAALRAALADPRQPSAAESWLFVSTARPQLGLSSDCFGQELSPEPCPSRNATLGRTTSRQHGEFHRPAGAKMRFPQGAASTRCGKPGVAAGGLLGKASPVAFQHPIPNHFGIEARKRAARVVREGVRAVLFGQQPVEDLHPCSGADPRIEQGAQRLVQQAPVEPDEVIVRPRVAFARYFSSLGADQRRLS